MADSDGRLSADQPDPVAGSGARPGRGHLRIYLGAAPGVGKTFAMLDEGHRRTSAAPTSSSASSRPTAARRPSRCSATSRSSPAQAGVPRRRVRGDGRRRGARPPPAGRAGRRARAHQHPGLAQREALAGRRGAARRRHRRDLDGQHPAPRVAQRRGREDHRRAAAGDGPRRRRAGGRPGRAGRHDARGAAPADGARQHLRRRRRSTPRSATTSGSATSPRCASWRCCGWPTRSTRGCSGTARARASRTPGRPGSGWSSR